MNPQQHRLEVFNRVEAHLLEQREWSERAGGQCAYRGEGGLKCAVGVLILDEAYCPDIEGRNCPNPMVIEALENSGIIFDEDWQMLDMLVNLQTVHDIEFTGHWKEKLTSLKNHLKEIGVLPL